MASRVRAGVEGHVSADVDVTAAVCMLCGQPHVIAGVIPGLVAAYRAAGSRVVASAYERRMPAG